jgi:hypothetical protein
VCAQQNGVAKRRPSKEYGSPQVAHQTESSVYFIGLLAGRVSKLRVRLRSVVGFSLEYEPEYTAQGHFARWRRRGVLRTKRQAYEVAPGLIRSWQRQWQWRLAAKTVKVGIRRGGLGQRLRVVDWHWDLVETVRRGGVWPRAQRKREGLPAAEIRHLEPFTHAPSVE